MSVQKAGQRHPALLAAAIVLASLALNLIYGIVVPPWMGPDEPRHVEYVLLIAEKGRLVTWADPMPEVEQRIIRSMDQYDFWRYGVVSPDVFKPGALPARFDQIWAQGVSHELHQPPLYYLLLAPVARLSGGLDVAVQMLLMRSISALLGALTVFIVWLTAREGFPDQPLMAMGAACLVALLPMHAFVAGIVNNDVLAEVTGSLLVYLLVRGERRGFSLKLLAACVVVVALALLAKRTTVFILPLLALALVLPLRRKMRRPSWRVAAAAVALTGALLWAGARILDVLARQSGRLPGPLQSLLYVYVFFLVRPSDMHAYSVRWHEFFSADALAYYRRWLQMLFETFWARFGWINVRLDWRLYVVLAAVTAVAVLGACLILWEALRAKRPAQGFLQDCLLLLGGAVLLALAVLLVKMVREWDSVPRATTQARFLFTALSPIAILFVAGLLRLLPDRYHSALVRGGVVALLLLNALSLLRYILPFYGLA